MYRKKLQKFSDQFTLRKRFLCDYTDVTDNFIVHSWFDYDKTFAVLSIQVIYGWTVFEMYVRLAYFPYP